MVYGSNEGEIELDWVGYGWAYGGIVELAWVGYGMVWYGMVWVGLGWVGLGWVRSVGLE